jgi:uncharacterized heparinase superfamily protein
MNVGGISPDFQPGHAHADSLNFVLYSNGLPVIVDKGISTYHPGPERTYERSTSAHNTVVVNGTNSSQVWHSFRVGKRAKVQILSEKENEIIASHDGYRKLGAKHKRAFIFDTDLIVIRDKVIAKTKTDNIAYFHFHPSVQYLVEDTRVNFFEIGITFNFIGASGIDPFESYYSPGFNQKITSTSLAIGFMDELRTEIKFTNTSN